MNTHAQERLNSFIHRLGGSNQFGSVRYLALTLARPPNANRWKKEDDWYCDLLGHFDRLEVLTFLIHQRPSVAKRWISQHGTDNFCLDIEYSDRGHARFIDSKPLKPSSLSEIPAALPHSIRIEILKLMQAEENGRWPGKLPRFETKEIFTKARKPCQRDLDRDPRRDSIETRGRVSPRYSTYSLISTSKHF
jgi:hypothetical protein